MSGRPRPAKADCRLPDVIAPPPAGPAIVGHANDEVNAALKEQLEKGTSFGAPCALENEMAKVVIERVPSVEMVRFCSSGTEACLSVLRLMRAYTKREKILKFVGCYHGHGDSFLVAAGSGVLTLGLPDSPGVPANVAASTLTATYNDLESVRRIFEANKGEIAGVILEPVVGNSGFIPPTKEFLEGLREITREDGALLCFDEVMTGFRVSKGCAQEHFGVTPDLTTMGKVIGGGLPVGAYGGRRDIMETVAPAGPMYQAGTLSGNPLAMVAGLKTLEILGRPGSYEYMDKITTRLINSIVEEGRKAGHAITGGNIRGMFGFFFMVSCLLPPALRLAWTCAARPHATSFGTVAPAGRPRQLLRGRQELRHGEVRALPPGDAREGGLPGAVPV